MTIRGDSNMIVKMNRSEDTRVRMYGKSGIGTSASGANSSVTLVYNIAIAMNGIGLQQMRTQTQ